MWTILKVLTEFLTILLLLFMFWAFDHEAGKSSAPLKVKELVAQSCPTLGDPMDCSPPGTSVHGTLQARMLQWVAMSSSRGSSRLRDQTQVSRIAGRFFTVWAPREAPIHSGFLHNTVSAFCVAFAYADLLKSFLMTHYERGLWGNTIFYQGLLGVGGGP